MKYLLTITVILLTTLFSNAQQLYTKSFGDSKNKPLIFIHGGPGSSSAAFGITTAQRLAAQGFYVILYDRRGEGLSKDENAKYNFQQTFEDLNWVFRKFNLHQATLIGFSFGGIISTLYTEKYPDHVKSLILVSSLLSQPETYQTILDRSKKIYQLQKDTANLKAVLRIEKMDPGSFEYRTDCYIHSSKNGFFATRNRNELAKSLYAKLDSDPVYQKLSAQKSDDPVKGFWKNEHYSTLSIVPVLKRLKSRKVMIYALYGKDDGLFSPQQIKDLQLIIGNNNLKYLNNCSHYLYADQQDQFINAFVKWAK